MVSDGCTGFWWAEWIWSIRDCCVEHDFGGSDGVLLDCLMSNTPQWTWPAVVLCLFIMVLFRPIYHWIKSR